MSLIKARIAAAFSLVITDWRTNGVAPSVRIAYQDTPDLDVVRDILFDFNRATLDQPDEFGADQQDLRNAYDLVTDPANREFVDAVATELYA